MTIGWGELAALVVGGGLGWGLAVLVRRFRIAGRMCRFCNGHGYFASSRDEAAVLGQVHEESASFRP